MLYYTLMLFPEGTCSNEREANGLPENSVPKNCTIVDSFVDSRYSIPGERREHYLVTVEDGTLIDLRVCSAFPGSGYKEFAAIMRTATSQEDKDALTLSFTSKKESFTS